MNQHNIAGSRLLTRLDSDIRRTFDPVDNACLRAERAMQLARLGQFDKAHQEMAALHGSFDRHPRRRSSAWICLPKLQRHSAAQQRGARQDHANMPSALPNI